MDARRGAVAPVVAEHELEPALLDRGPLAGVEQRLKLIQARRRGRAAAVTVPGKPAPAAHPPPDTVHGGERHQADDQAREGRENIKATLGQRAAPPERSWRTIPSRSSGLRVR